MEEMTSYPCSFCWRMVKMPKVDLDNLFSEIVEKNKKGGCWIEWIECDECSAD